MIFSLPYRRNLRKVGFEEKPFFFLAGLFAFTTVVSLPTMLNYNSALLQLLPLPQTLAPSTASSLQQDMERGESLHSTSSPPQVSWNRGSGRCSQAVPHLASCSAASRKTFQKLVPRFGTQSLHSEHMACFLRKEFIFWTHGLHYIIEKNNYS